jgi:WD repeat-containing protein 42A
MLLVRRESGESLGVQTNLKHRCACACISRLRLARKIRGGSGCVNTVRFHSDGVTCATSGDDCAVHIWNAHSGALRCSAHTGHSGNVFSAIFLPAYPSILATCAADGEVRLVDSHSGAAQLISACQRTALKLDVVPSSPHCLVSSQLDRSVRLFDIRERPQPASSITASPNFWCSDPFALLKFEEVQPTSQAVFDPLRPNLFAVATDDLYVNIFDLRARSKHWGVAGPLATYLPADVSALNSDDNNFSEPVEGASGLAWHPDGSLAANYRGADAFLLDASPSGQAEAFHSPANSVLATYRGRENKHTFLKYAVAS